MKSCLFSSHVFISDDEFGAKEALPCSTMHSACLANVSQDCYNHALLPAGATLKGCVRKRRKSATFFRLSFFGALAYLLAMHWKPWSAADWTDKFREGNGAIQH